MGHGAVAARVEVRLLGAIGASVDGQVVELGGPRQQVLLAVLGARAGHRVDNDVLVDAIWDGAPPDGAARTFRSYVARLRRSFDRAGADGASVVRTDSGGYRLDDAVATDAERFEAEAGTARDHLARGELADALACSASALGRWSGRAFGPFADRIWAVPVAVRLEELRLATTELRARALVDAGRVPQAVALLEELAAEAPQRESVARVRALALHRAGRDAAAMRVLREFRERLRDEHGLDPSDQVAALETMVLERDPRLDRPVGGRQLRGYVLHEPVTRSPLGVVHRAEQPSIGRAVAVAVVPEHAADDPTVVRAFEERLQTVAALDHPHVVPVYDYWREPGGGYVVTRLPSGTLEQALRAGRVTARDAVRIGGQVASALASAHESGVVHGAVTPDAVVVDERGDAALWGFPLTPGDVTPAQDVAGLAAMITTVAATAPVDADRAVGARRAPFLSPGVVALLDDARRLDADHVVTAAGLATALRTVGPGGDPVPLAAPGPNPYRGLAAFRETDASVFFGRERLVETLVARVHRDRAVVLVGPSGSGKSSAARAGLLPRLRSEGAFVTTMVPGPHPLAELEVALSRVAAAGVEGLADTLVADPAAFVPEVRRVLPDPGADLVLLVDQFEELFTLADATERDLLLDVLATTVADPTGPVRVVCTLRTDFLGQVLHHSTAGPLVRDRAVMVGPLDDDELHDAVVRPAEVAGVAVEPGLAAAAVADAVRSPGSLPMLQFALTEVFEAAEDGVMTLASYRRIGGIEGVLGQRAEEVYATLDADAQRAAHALFQRLVTPNDDGPPARRRALRSELPHVPDVVLSAFGDARLLLFDHDDRSREPTVEVTHEALFGAWRRLRDWIEEDEATLRLLGHLSSAAAMWDAGGRDEAELYRGRRLDAATDYVDTHRGELSPVELAFVRAGRGRRDRDRAADRRALRRLRVLTGALAAGLVLALGAGAAAWTSGRRASAAQQRETATARSAQVDALAAAAAGAVAEDVERASLLAAEAYALEPDIESQAALLAVLDVEPRILSVRPTPFDTCSERTGTSEVVLFTTVTLDGELYELRTLDQEVLRRMTPPASGTATCAGITPSGDHVFVRHVDRYEVLDLEMRRVAVRDDVLAPADQRSMVVHPSRPTAVLALEDGTIAEVSLPDLETVRELDLDLDDTTSGGSGPVRQSGGQGGATLYRALAHSEDATLLAVADAGAVHVVDAAGAVIASLEAGETAGGTRPFVAAGTGRFGHLAARHLVVAPLDDATVVTRIELSSAATPYRQGVAVEPGGRRVAVATEAGVEVVDLVAGIRIGTPIRVDASILDLFWTDEGRLNALGPNGLHRFDVDRPLVLGDLAVSFDPAEAQVLAVAPDASGVVVVGPSEDGGPRLRYRHADTGATVDLGPPSSTAGVPVVGGRWFALDVATATVRVGDAVGGTADVAVPELAGGTGPPSLATAGDRVAALLPASGATGDDPGRSSVVLFDAVSGAVERHHTPAGGVTWTAAIPGAGDDVLLADTQYRWTLLRGDEGAVDGPRVLGAGQEVGAIDPRTGRYATADWNGDLHVVDPGTGTVVDLAGPASFATDVLFAPGDRLVSRHIDGSTYLWDVGAARLVGRLWRSAPFTFLPLAVDTDANEVVQVTPGGLARLPLDPDRWFELACARVDRRLTAAELTAVAPGVTPGPGCGRQLG